VFAAYFFQAQVFTAMNLIIVAALGITFVPVTISGLKFANILGSFSSGFLSDRYSKAVILSALVCIALVGIWLFTVFTAFVPLFAGAALLGLAMASIYPVSLAWLKDALPEDEYIYGVGIFHVYNNMGVLGGIASNFLMSPRWSFLPGIIALVLALGGIALFTRLLQRYKKLAV
jgi:MFS family permease